jgi:hypothetical protein
MQPVHQSQCRAADPASRAEFRPPVSSVAVRSRGDQREQAATGLETWDFRTIPVFASRPGARRPRLAVGLVDDPLEREADSMADQVMRTPDADVSLIGSSAQEAPAAVHEVLRGSGQPLDAATRAFMEPRFHYDFSRVRLHTDAAAAQSAKAVNARAYTVGTDVAFAPQMYAPHSQEGRRLLAHELAHTIQQRAAPADALLVQRQPGESAGGAQAASSAPTTSRFQDELSKNPAMAKAYIPIREITGKLVGYSRTSNGYMEIRNTDGEIVYSDEVPLEHGLPIIDSALDLIEAGLKQLGYVAVGTLDTVLENNWRAMGLPSNDAHEQPIAKRLGIPRDAKAYKIGRGAGHALTLLESAAAYVDGATLFISGVGEFIAGVATTPAGGLGLVVLPVAAVQVAAGTTVIIYGGALGQATLMNMMSNEGDAGGGGGGGEGGGGGGGGAKKPELRPNPAHDPKSSLFNPRKTPEPPDAATAYQNAVEGERGVWYGKSETGEIYRYSSDNAGGAHFSGQTGGTDGIRLESIPIKIRRIFGKVK